MKLVRYGQPGRERPGIWLEAAGADAARIVDVRGMAFDIEDYNARFWRTHGLERLRGLLAEEGLKTLAADGVRLGPPVPPPRRLICLGKNYRDHAEEFDARVPAQPIYFAKNPGALCGPADEIRLRPGARADAEVELAVVIGRPARAVAEEDALDHVAGYTILNDVTDRDLQAERDQWFLGKSADTFGPLGPWLVTTDELPDPQALGLRQRVNELVLQDSHTERMLFGVARILADLTHVLTLEPGDIISTGTPGGIGSARRPPVWLRDGDVVECEIDGVGRLRNRVRME
ncbi:MAG: fumarylacetoacetate hydrolase family protein [Lentisphaerae bacterium]|jgi:2-keto-4-pentenoate hydratase/2-oxohepta-3-ene-1,7-dioic acid hydratase in catechol pathway|nr:fumarylacetoacetate hydrolase family protein [Lentisphaerota bacterium]